MEECVDKGKIMVFGYPMICYSPIRGNTEKKKDEFWKPLFRETMNKREEDEQIIIAEIIDQID
jgi:hypothetical protein